MITELGLLFFLNIAYVFCLWHMDVSHNIDRLGQEKTRGVFNIKPETAYRLSQYGLIIALMAIDLIFLI